MEWRADQVKSSFMFFSCDILGECTSLLSYQELDEKIDATLRLYGKFEASKQGNKKCLVASLKLTNLHMSTC